MNDQEFDYLSAELAMAQSQGATSFLVNAKDMQALLHTARLWRATVGKPKLCGFMSSDEIRSLCDGNLPSTRVVRKATDHRCTPVYFIELEGEDLRTAEEKVRANRKEKRKAEAKRLADKGIVVHKPKNELQLSLELLGELNCERD
jgi:hypothetical protein